MKSQTSEPNRWWDLSAAVILLFANFLAALRLSATDWTDELGIIQLISLVGLAIGLGLGQSRFHRIQATWYGIALGIFTIGWQLGLTFTKGALWSERLISLGGRLLHSSQDLLQQRAVSDPILFLTLMGILFWALNVHAGYALTRHANAWRATLPTGLALFIVHIYDPYWPNRTWFVASYIFLSLLLLSRTHFLRSRAEWKQNRTHLPPYIGLDFLRATMLVGGVLVLLSWTIPALASSVPPIERAWQKLAQPWYEARSRMSNAFASLRATVGITQDYYGDVLPLGRGNTLTDIIVFQVKAPTPPSTGVRYYWRDRIYDTWNGSSWSSNPAGTRDLSPQDAALPFANLEGRWEASFVFFPAIQSFTIHMASQPQWISRPAEADIVVNPDSTVDLLSVKTTPSLRAGEIYEVQASLSNVTVNQLRATGTNYPIWILERYLQLPNTLSDRTIELAKEIAEGRETPYDISEAVTQWLRESITYSDRVPIPPAEQDIIDWMLFDLKQGFCNYYATTEIMLLRSLGIPARLAVGYAQGELDAETGLYTVRQRDAHAWVEVYFSGIGWVEFEPTLNQRPLRRPLGDPIGDGTNNNLPDGVQNNLDLEALLGFEALADDPLLNPPETPDDNAGLLSSPWVLVIAIAGVGLIIAVFFAWSRSLNHIKIPDPANPPLPVKIDKTIQRFGLKTPNFLRRWVYHATLPVQAKSYQVINDSLHRLGSPATVNNTPAERAATLIGLLPTATDPIQILLNEYQHLTYANGTAQDSHKNGASALAAFEAARAVRNQTWITIGQRFLSRFQQPKRKDTIIDWQR